MLIMLSLGLWGCHCGFFCHFIASCDGCMTKLWYIIWFNCNWYPPAEFDASNQLVLQFCTRIPFTSCTSVGAVRVKFHRSGTACFWTMLDGAVAHHRVSSLCVGILRTEGQMVCHLPVILLHLPLT